MGRILDTLKRRESNGNPAAEAAEADPPAIPRPATPAGDEGWSLGAGAIPFIEVPGEAMSAGEAASPAAMQPDSSGASSAAHFLPTLVAERETGAHPAYQAACEALWQHLRAAQLKSLVLLPIGFTSSPAAHAANLAEALVAARSRSVLLIDADGAMVAPVKTAMAGGWTGLLAGMPPEQVILEGGWHGLHVIAAGQPLARPTPVDRLHKARAVLGALTRRYDLVLLLAANWQSHRLPSLLVHAANGVCLLLERSPEAGRKADIAAGQLQDQQVNVIGSLVLEG